jgi:hypothetical protein
MSKERGLELFYVVEGGGHNYGRKNQRAANIAKTPVVGNALLLQHSIEPSRSSRRYTHYPMEAYCDVFTRAKKKPPPPPPAAVGLSGEEYSALKAEMLVSSSSLEAQLSAAAQTPRQLGKMKPLPPLSGKSLARRSAQKQAEPPRQQAEPPQVQRQAAERVEVEAADF